MPAIPSCLAHTQVYSFGIVLWEMLTQQSPFSGMAAYQVVDAVVRRGERPPWPTDGSVNIFGPLRSMAERCWQSDRTLRPCFFELVDALRELADPLGNCRLLRPPTNGSEMTDESDELELALRQQQKRRTSRTGKAGEQVSYQSSEPESLLISGPPKDQLGRMLYFLAQVRPQGGPALHIAHSSVITHAAMHAQSPMQTSCDIFRRMHIVHSCGLASSLACIPHAALTGASVAVSRPCASPRIAPKQCTFVAYAPRCL